MQKKIAAILFSTRLMGVLFIAYAVAMIVGTFLDVGQETSPTPYSRELIYDTWWFEAIHILFAINFFGNIFRFKLLRKEKLTTLVFHASFFLILLGAGITRYISFEGVMPIEEGTSENTFLSEKTYLEVFIDGEIDGKMMRRTVQRKLNLSPRLDNDFVWQTDYNGTPITIAFDEFIDGAEESLVEDTEGDLFLKIVEAGDGSRHEHYVQEGEVANVHNVLYAFNKPQEGAISITFEDGVYFLTTPFAGTVMTMATQEQNEVLADIKQPLRLRSLYNVQGIQFVVPDPARRGRYGIVEKEVKEKNQTDGLFVNVSTQGETKRIGLLGGKGYALDKKMVEVGDFKMYLSYGSEQIQLPFSIKLNDFIATRYPGTENSYAAFESKITVEDEEPFDYRVYMNHVLDHKGYRFFQASFFPDESGTILSVSHDFWGTWITYIGYFLLYIGMLLILIDKGSRFGKLRVQLEKLKAKKAKLGAVILLLFAFAKAHTAYAQEINTAAVQIKDTVAVQTDVVEDILGNLTPEKHEGSHLETPKAVIDSVILASAVDKEHAAKFGRIVIQDDGGRMMPINTFSSLLLRKLNRKDSYLGLTADQVMVSMIENPIIWYNADILYLKKGNDSLRNIIGVPKDEKRFKAIDFFNEKGNYELAPYMQDAYAATVPTVFDKEFRDVDQRLALLNRTLGGEILKIFPKPNDPNNTWVSYPALNEAGFKGMDSLYTKQIIPLYIQSIRKARETGDYSMPDQLIESIAGFQKKFGEEVMPSPEKIEAEIYYNEHDVFKKLYWLYMLVAFIMIVVAIVQIFKNSKGVRIVLDAFGIAVLLLWLVHTGGLAWRWYISGHAPWSDAYESVLYVAWATMFFGLAFGRKSRLTLAATAFVAGFILLAASMNWMNPEIANLQAVLNSYWLMIHTGVIVASYGPFALGFMLGLVCLFLMIFTTEKNKAKMDLHIKELTIINEMALTIGMVLLAIGTFLGGQWANESWGRYWGWDPKETWALISLIVYAFVIHMRLIPGLRGKWLFNLLSIVALGSILFTYFGVNYYLAGLHAYQSGGDLATNYIYASVAVIAILGTWSYIKYKKYYKK